MRQGANGNLEDVFAVFLVILLVALAIGLVIMICYLLTLQKALSRVAPHNRLMEPGQVWLLLVPCVNIVWQFMVATRLPDSLKNEFRERGRDDGSDYGKGIALTSAILGLFGGGFNFMSRGSPEMAQLAGCGAGLLGLVNLALFITFWVKIANYSSQLASDDYGPGDFRRGFDKYDDDRDSPRRGPPAPSPETYRPEDEGYRPQ